MGHYRAYLLPASLKEAIAATKENRVAVVAGGTDLLPKLSRGLCGDPETVVSLSRIEELRGIEIVGDEVRIGACTQLSEVASDPIVEENAPLLSLAACRVACPQVRNRATLGGNLCNASPAADAAVPLLLLDAVLELVSWDGSSLRTRNLPISTFFLGPGRTALERGEILVRIKFQRPKKDCHTAWDKFGRRPSMGIAVASVGIALLFKGATVVDARVGYGSVAPVPMRGRKVESYLSGNRLSDETIRNSRVLAREEIEPITDVRSSKEFRREVVGVMLGRMLREARSHGR